MKNIFVLLLILCMASMAGATTVSFVDEGLTIIAYEGEVVRLYVTTDVGLIGLDAVATVTGGDIIVDAGCYCDDPYPPIIPIGLDTPTVEIGCGCFTGMTGVVAYYDVLFTGGEQIVSIANGTSFGGSFDTSFSEPVFSDGVVTIVSEYSNTCWDPDECAGQTRGDATCDGSINLADLFALKAAWGKAAPWTPPHCCADFNHDGRIDLGDIIILKINWGMIGFMPSTGNQNCSP